MIYEFYPFASAFSVQFTGWIRQYRSDSQPGPEAQDEGYSPD